MEGEALARVLRQSQVAVDDREVGEEGPHALDERLAVLVAELLRAEMRLRLHRVQVVRAAEQREEVVGVVEVEREVVFLREESGEHRRDRAGRPLVHGRRVAVPGRVACEPGEVGVAGGVDLTLRVHERDGRKLVEDDHDDRGVGRHLGQPRLGRVLEDETRHRRDEQEQDEEDERRGSQDGQEHPRRPRARVEEGRRGTDGCCGADQQERRGIDPADDLKHDQPDEAADEGEVKHGGREGVSKAGERLQGEQHEGRDDDQPDGEEHDVPAGRAADGEELDVAGEKVEDRLCDRDGAQAREMQARRLERPGRVRRMDSHGRECASPRGASRGARRASAR